MGGLGYDSHSTSHSHSHHHARQQGFAKQAAPARSQFGGFVRASAGDASEGGNLMSARPPPPPPRPAFSPTTTTTVVGEDGEPVRKKTRWGVKPPGV
uniref:Uncharacterized protein n=1 Tax=Palpitomonas bilix TaxID=652834 RepID=A0A7S3GEF5_9EUKA